MADELDPSSPLGKICSHFDGAKNSENHSEYDIFFVGSCEISSTCLILSL